MTVIAFSRRSSKSPSRHWCAGGIVRTCSLHRHSSLTHTPRTPSSSALVCVCKAKHKKCGAHWVICAWTCTGSCLSPVLLLCVTHRRLALQDSRVCACCLRCCYKRRIPEYARPALLGRVNAMRITPAAALTPAAKRQYAQREGDGGGECSVDTMAQSCKHATAADTLV